MLTRNPARRTALNISRENRSRERRVALATDLSAYRAAGYIARIVPGEFMDGTINILAPCGKWIEPILWGGILDTACFCDVCHNPDWD